MLIGLSVEDHPVGYPRLGCFLDSDEAFMVYRRFGLLHSRLLLYKQEELRRLEQYLLALDNRDSRTEEGQDRLTCWTRDQQTSGVYSRKELMDKIETKSLEYGGHPS